jgi:hypothetical protein
MPAGAIWTWMFTVTVDPNPQTVNSNLVPAPMSAVIHGEDCRQMNSELGRKMDRRRLLTSLAAGTALTVVPSLISAAGEATPQRIFRFASPGNAAIVTSGGLIETDPGLRHVGELAHRLDNALRKRKVLDQLARAQAHFFALGSATLNGPGDPLIFDFQTTLDRQSDFVSHRFCPLALDDLPIYVATALPDDREVRDAVLDVLVYITCKSGFWRDAKIFRPSEVFCMVDEPRYQADTRGPGDLVVAVIAFAFFQGCSRAYERTLAPLA